MSWRGRESLPDVREWSEGPPRCPGLVGRPSQMSGSCWKTLPDVREWSGDPLECLGVVESRPRCPGVVVSPSQMSGRPSQMSGSGQETLLNV